MKIVEGRATRGEFAKVFFLVLLAAAIISAPPLIDALPKVVMSIVLLIFVLLGNYFLITTGVRRLHDFDKSGWWCLVILVPLANIALIIALLFMPSAKRVNAYGEQK
ncbi:DUF805 domain-containing protein [Chromohalobacter israelensis]|uniref:DUF805 domain-containing protein n=1 Tax=Chromohalobacter israelensis TaxID=141390 RepID=UPI000D7171ED|nr:DUF805 domain-containing protein [Chromohalobacter salexigens]